MKTHAGHITNLPIVRMVIVTLIAFGYASTMPRGPDKSEYLRLFGYDPSWYGISLLFMISGYLAMRSLMRHGSGLKMLTSRAARTLPILALFALSVIIIIYPIFGHPNPTDAPGLGDKLVYFIKVVSCFNPNADTPGLLDNALYACIIQGGLWTFRWGALLYIGTAVAWSLGIFKDKRLVLFLFVFSLVSYAGLVNYSATHPDMKYRFVLTALQLTWPYLLGMSVYAYRDRLPRNGLVPFLFLAAAAINYFFLTWTPYIEILTELGFGYLVFLMLTSRRTLPTSLTNIPDLSLGLYVFNWPMAQISLLLMPGISPIALFIISFTCTVLISVGLWWVIKRPVDMKINTYSQRSLSM